MELITDGKPHLVVVDDDPKIVSLMEKFLSAYGFEVLTADCGEAVYKLLDTDPVDLIILDVMLPGEDGFEICKKIRQKYQTPIVMLTAVGEGTERILGLELGADDYLTKPFNPHELLARVKAVLRRSLHKQENIELERNTIKLVFQGWILDKLLRRLLSPQGVDVTLTDGEYRLLEALAEHPQQVLSRDTLAEMVQNRHGNSFDRSIDVRISRLRQKIEPDPKIPRIIKTVRGGGYIFAVKVEKHVE
jgi:two-component system OmpR family response regulator